MFNSRLGFGPDTEAWEVSLLVRNLTDKDDILVFSGDSLLGSLDSAAEFGGRVSFVEPGRTVTLRGTLNF